MIETLALLQHNHTKPRNYLVDSFRSPFIVATVVRTPAINRIRYQVGGGACSKGNDLNEPNTRANYLLSEYLSQYVSACPGLVPHHIDYQFYKRRILFTKDESE